MIVFQTVAVALAMFSALPVPQFDWNEKNMRYALCAFPLVGVICGALWCLCGALPLPDAAQTAGFCLIPVWVTGGIHLDGYADTCDALASYGDTAKKACHIKDPHCGAFAVIRLCSYFAAYLMLCACVQFTPRTGCALDAGPDGERMLSGLAVAAFPLAKIQAGPHLCNGCGPPNGLPCFGGRLSAVGGVFSCAASTARMVAFFAATEIISGRTLSCFQF